MCTHVKQPKCTYPKLEELHGAGLLPPRTPTHTAAGHAWLSSSLLTPLVQLKQHQIKRGCGDKNTGRETRVNRVWQLCAGVTVHTGSRTSIDLVKIEIIPPAESPVRARARWGDKTPALLGRNSLCLAKYPSGLEEPEM